MILNKSQLIANITTELSDNATDSLTPYHVRHNLLDIIDSTAELIRYSDISANNIKTPAHRTTIVGQRAIERVSYPNYYSEDNSAIGFSALRLNFRGVRNTAIGSQALRTNIYGSDNVGIGFDSLAGNVTGSGNVAIGNFGLISNKTGSFNIAIGHGAGYYVSPDDSYKFFLGSGPVDSGTLCYDVDGVNFTPLLHGDLNANRLGINTRTLIGDAVLQTSGDITPSMNNAFNIGSSGFLWKNVYSSNLFLSPSHKISYTDNAYFNFDFLPENNNTFNIGSSSNNINQIYTDVITVNNIAYLNDAEFIHSSHYMNKTLNLASRYQKVQLDGGGPFSLYDHYSSNEEDNIQAPFLTSEQVNGAGFVVHASGDAKYSLLLDTTNPNNTFWKSNINFVLPSSGYLQASTVKSNDRFVADIQSNTSSFILDNNYLYFGNKSFYGNNDLGIGNINFVNDVDNETYKISYLHPSSGIIQQRFFSRASGPENSSIEPYIGFSVNAYDLNTSGYFTIESFNDGSRFRKPVNSVIINRDSHNILKITDSNVAKLPSEALDIDVANKAHIKITSRSQFDSAGINLVRSANNAQIALRDSLSFYVQDVKAVDIKSYAIGLYNNVSGSYNFSLSIGDAVYKNASIGMRHSDTPPTSAAKYAGVFTKEKIVGNTQSSTLMFIDSSGNLFDVIRSPYNTEDGLLFSNNTNTTGGKDSATNKNSLTGSDNTAIGYSSLKDITTGSKNTTYGSQAGKSLTTGSYNVCIGHNTLASNKTNDHNICIGTNGIGNDITSDYNFSIGVNDNLVLLRGKMGPNNANKYLELPNNGNIVLQNSTNTESLKLSSNSIQIIDKGGSNYPDFSFDVVFSGNASNTLVSFNHEDAPLSYSSNYAPVDGPFMQLNGHLKIKGDICFNDGSKLSQSPQAQISSIENSQNSLLSTLSSLLIEGVAINTINKPSNINSPIVGMMQTINGDNISIHNRDPNLTIKSGDYVIAIKIGQEYRPIWVSNEFNALVSF